MNLHAIASRVISSVNPMMQIMVQVSAGSITAPDGTRAPSYAAPVIVPGQVQSLTFTDLTQIDNLNIQGLRRAIYINGFVEGLVREQNKGGDLIMLPPTPEFPSGSTWLVAQVLESWSDWCKVVVTLQAANAYAPQQGSAPVGLLSDADNGLGIARYADASSQGSVTLDAGARTLFTMTIDPAQTIAVLKGPFTGQVMWDGTVLHAVNVNDAYQVRVALNATSTVAGGHLKIEAQIAGSSPPAILDTKTELLPDQANTPERIAFEMLLYAGASVVSSGISFYLTSSVPVSILNETVLIAPLNAGP